MLSRHYTKLETIANEEDTLFVRGYLLTKNCWNILHKWLRLKESRSRALLVPGSHASAAAKDQKDFMGNHPAFNTPKPSMHDPAQCPRK